MDAKIIGAAVAILIIAAGAYYLLSGSNAPAYYPTTTATAPTTAQGYTTTQAYTTAQSSTVESTVATTASGSASYTVTLRNSSTLGEYLANSTGFTLYIYTSDVAYSNQSVCYYSCATSWPPFYTDTLSLPLGLNAPNFGTITRSDGGMQLTYKGYPLYFYAGDYNAGDVNGQNLFGFKVATP